MQGKVRVPNPFKVRETNNLEFWVSNLVIIVSTVLGVYLAAQAGYRTALDFETARGERENYYLRRALLEEVRDNLDQADKFADFVVDRNGWRFTGTAETYKLQSYVWETMRQQTTTFQTPPEILTAVRRYYESARGYADSLARGQGTAIEAAKAWREDTKKVRETTLPALEQSIATLRQRLEARGVPLE